MKKNFRTILIGLLFCTACVLVHPLKAQERDTGYPQNRAACILTPPPSEFCSKILKFAAENAIAPQLQMQFCLAVAMLGFPNFDGAAQNAPVRITFEKERAFAEVLAEKDSEFQKRLSQFASPTFGDGNGKYRVVAIPLRGTPPQVQCLSALPQLSPEQIKAMPLLDAVVEPEALAEILKNFSMDFMAESAKKSLGQLRAEVRLARARIEITACADLPDGAEFFAKTPSKDLSILIPEAPQKAVCTFSLARPAQIDFSKAGEKLPKVSATGAFAASSDTFGGAFAAVFEVAPDGGDFRGKSDGAHFAKKSTFLVVATEEQTLEKTLQKIDSVQFPAQNIQRLTLEITADAPTKATLEITPVFGASGRAEALAAKAEIPAVLLKAAAEKFTQNGGANGKN